MIKKPLIVILLLAAGILNACSKGGAATDDGTGSGHLDNPADTIPPVLVVNTPTDNQVYANGNSIVVSGRITDNAGLYRGSIRITNDANGAVLKEQIYEIHGVLGYNFNVSYNAVVTAVSDYTATVSFEDHGSNAVSRSVKVKVNP